MNFFNVRVLRGTILDFSRRQNVVFWVSQCAVVLSTIVGVYLAASEGLKSAVEFHAATTLERKYFMLNSLRAEIENNNLLINEFSERNLVQDEEGNVTAHRSMIAPNLNWFVWNTISRSTEALDLPVDILHGFNNYYSKMTNLVDSYHDSRGAEKLRNGRELQSLSTTETSALEKRMDEQISKYRATLANYDTLGSY